MDWRRAWNILTTLCFLSFALNAASEPAPIIVEPSGQWQGDDGSWSTFSIRLGNPDQALNVLVSTAWANTVAVSNYSCSDGSTSSCATSRGGVFAPNSSSSWQSQGKFTLFTDLNTSHPQNTASFGMDSIGLGTSSAGPKLGNQVIATTEADDLYLGLLGINPQPRAWSAALPSQAPSFLGSLQILGMIPSLSYSYTAGAPYRLKEVLGSLVFGGYDAARVLSNDLTFSFLDGAQPNLVVNIQKIQAATSKSTYGMMDGDSILAAIDSTIPYLVLPYEVCLAFEQALGLEWSPDEGSDGLYTLTDAQHFNLTTTNPNITFTLGEDSKSSESIEITLPYAAFDLQGQPPLVNSTTKYFPLLRAASDSQAILGRVFLQEAMLIADFERGNFSVWPCVWNENTQQPNIVTIQSLNDTNSTSETASNASASQQQSLARATRIAAGLGVGIGIPLLIIAVYLAFARWKRRWPFPRPAPRQKPRPLMEPNYMGLYPRVNLQKAESYRSASTSVQGLTHAPSRRADSGISVGLESVSPPPMATASEEAELEGDCATTAQSTPRNLSISEPRHLHVAHLISSRKSSLLSATELAGSSPARTPIKFELESRSPLTSRSAPQSRRVSQYRPRQQARPPSDPMNTTSELPASIPAAERPPTIRKSSSSSNIATTRSVRRHSGGRMLMELPGMPVSPTYLKSHSPARTPPRSPRSPASPRMPDSELPPLPALPAGAATLSQSPITQIVAPRAEAYASTAASSAAPASEYSLSVRSVSRSGWSYIDRAASLAARESSDGRQTPQSQQSPRDEYPPLRNKGSRKVLNGGYF